MPTTDNQPDMALLPAAAASSNPPVTFARLLDNRAFLSGVFMLPAALLLGLFLTYPLGRGIWLGFTNMRIGGEGVWVGLENYISLFDDSVFWMSVWQTFFYTAIATVLKFALGLWLALLLNHNFPFKALVRAFILLPYIIPTVLSAIVFWWMYDTQFSIITWSLQRMGLVTGPIDFLGDPWNARMSLIFANVWRGIPFVAICLLAGLQTISPSLYEAAALDGANGWQRFRHVTVPMLMPILSIVLTFSVLFTFTDFQLIYAITKGGPINSTHLMATLAFQRAIPGGHLGEGAAIATAMIPFLVIATLISYFALQRRRWQQGGRDE